MILARRFVETSRIPVEEKWGYIWATRGQIWTQAAQNATTNAQAKEYGQKWVGKHVSDCSGLVKWCLIKLGSNCAHGSNSIWRNYLSDKGTINKGTELKSGMLVFKYRKNEKGEDDWYHVGVYDDGYVNQAQNTKNGCKRTKLDSSWTHWGKLKMVDYGKEKEEESDISMEPMVVTCTPGETVKLRKTPNKTGIILAKIPNGTVVLTEDENSEWTKVTWNGKTGYMMACFLEEPAVTDSPSGDIPADDELVTLTLPYSVCKMIMEAIANVGRG